MIKEAREFQVQLTGWTETHELPGGWPSERLLALLDLLEVDDVSKDDALEMCLLALQEFESGEAADRVLQVVFGDTMRPGVRRNLAHNLTDDRPWEEFAEISQQAGIFNALVLLQEAFPREFGKPDAVSVLVRVESASETGRAWLDAPSPDPALLLRILAQGMGDRAVLRRVFGDALAGTAFPEAAGVVWHVSRLGNGASAREFALVSSHQWFDSLEDLESWTAKAWPDLR